MAAPLLLACALAVPLQAQDWSVGVASGPFAFGKFAVRSQRVATEQPTGDVSRTKLSASPRAGLAIDVERRLGERFALRAEGTFTEAPLVVRDESGGGVALGAGRLDVATFTLPLVFRLNPRGTFRFHLLGGPAYAVYHSRRRQTAAVSITPYLGSRSRLGVATGGGVDWWFSERFAAEAQVVDIVTSSPFKRSDFAASARVKIPKPHNVHTSFGVRWRF